MRSLVSNGGRIMDPLSWSKPVRAMDSSWILAKSAEVMATRTTRSWVGSSESVMADAV